MKEGCPICLRLWKNLRKKNKGKSSDKKNRDYVKKDLPKGEISDQKSGEAQSTELKVAEQKDKEIKENKQEAASEEKPHSNKTTEKNRGIAAFTTNSLKLVPANYQHIGARERQEDAFAFSDLSDSDFVREKGVLAVVADGMGGLAKGDKASQVAVSIFLREYNNRENSDPLGRFLRRTINIANYAVFDLALGDDEQEIDLGTTVVAAAVHEGKMHWISAGDSLIYLYRDNRLEQLNKMHIYANQLESNVKKGLISRKEAEEHPERGFLTSYLGMPELYEVDGCLEPVTLMPGDTVLICSDGLTNTLTVPEIKEILNQSSGNIAEELVSHALEKQKKHQDNITVLVLTCEPAEQPLKGDEDENE